MAGSVWPDGKTSMDWYSVAGLMRDFEEQTACSFRFTISLEVKQRRPDLLITCEAVPLGAASTAVAPLALRRILASSAGLGSLMGLLTFLLYQVDFELEDVHGEDEVKKSEGAADS